MRVICLLQTLNKQIIEMGCTAETLLRTMHCSRSNVGADHLSKVYFIDFIGHEDRDRKLIRNVDLHLDISC